MKRKPYYITTAITYASGKPHIGNVYEVVMADALARFKKKQGYDVFFQTGTDEHGEKVQLKAEAKGITPQQYVDEVSDGIKEIFRTLNIEADRFIRTTDRDHEAQVKKIFKKLYDQGDIYKGVYEGWYCTPCESFWTESQLVDGKCPDCGREVAKAQEEAYYFRMSKYADRLLAYYEENPQFITPVSRKNEMVNNFLKPGLQDLCVSRSTFTWGVPLPWDPRHVSYVWIDALSNYITGIGYDAEGKSSSQYRKYWPADVHLIGKDIVRFHAIYWPIILMALGEPLPKSIFGHPWLLQDGGKMSKSKGNVLYPDELCTLFGTDAIRYYLLSQVPFDNDGLITIPLVTEVCNTALANTYGNLLSRTVAMCHKYCGGVVVNKGIEEAVDEELKTICVSAYPRVAQLLDRYLVADAMDAIFAIFGRANKYIDETAPWVLAKSPESADRLSTVLYNLVEALTIGTSLLLPFLPQTATQALNALHTKPRAFADLEKWGLYPNGNKVNKEGSKLFDRLDLDAVQKRFEELHAPKEEPKRPEVAPIKPLINIDQFATADIRVGVILSCEKVPKSSKLLCSQVDFGEDKPRQIVSGIAAYYRPEDMVGKRVVAVVNLNPAKLCGVVSEGMILCATTPEGGVTLLAPGADCLPGAEVR